MAGKCPNCGKPTPPRAENPNGVFCSERCRMVDLAKWLGEEFRIPERTPEEREDEGGPEQDGYAPSNGGGGDLGGNSGR